MKQETYSQFEFAKKKKNLKILGDLYEQNPKDIFIKFEYARLLVERGFIDDGREILLELLNTDNEDYAKLELAKIYAAENNIEEARSYLTELAERNDRYGLLELGILEAHEQNVEVARKILNGLIEKYNDQRAMLELARLEKSLGNNKTAAESFEILQESENAHLAKYELGVMEYKKRHLDRAKEIFLSLFNEPNADKAKFMVAKIEAEIGNINEARFYFQELNRTTKDQYAKFELARLEERVENYDDARKTFEELYEETKDTYVILELGMLEANVGNFDKARKYFKQLINTEDSKYAYRLLLLLEVKTKNYAEALKIVNEMISKDMNINIHIALLLSKELNIFIKDYNYRINGFSYNTEQIIEYDISKAIEHIVINHCKSKDKSCFNRTVNIKSLIHLFSENLSEKDKVNIMHFNDTYYVPCENLGNDNQKYIKVVTLPNTHDIISMYPVYDKYEISDDDEELEKYKTYAKRRKGK